MKMARPLAASRLVLGAGPILAAVALGLLYPLAAYVTHPLALPALLALTAVALVTVSRPEIGVAAGLVIVAVNPAAFGPPWLLGAMWAGFLLVVSITRSAIDEGRQNALPALGLVTLLFFAATVLGLALTPDSVDALPILRSTVTGIALFFVIATQVQTKRQVQWVVDGASFAAALVGGYAMLQYLTGASSSAGFFTSSGELVSRATAGFGPNQLGGFLVVLVPIALAGVVLANRGRLLYVVAAVLASVGIYASFSRSALVALAVAPLAFLRWRHVLLILPLLVGVALLGTPGLIRERFATLTDGGAEVAARTDIWRTAASIWTEHPVLGGGLGSFPSAYAKTRLPGKQFLPATPFTPPPHAHNLILHLLAEQGLVGLAAFLAVIAAALHRLIHLRWRAEQWISVTARALLASGLAFLIHNQFDVTLLERTAIYFWALLGLVSAVTRIAGAPTRAMDGANRAPA